jgi:hypothetical protein
VTAPAKPGCHTQQVLDQLDAAERDALNRALVARHVTTGQIVGVLGKYGHDLRTENVNRHRRRLRGDGLYACKCPLPDAQKATP